METTSFRVVVRERNPYFHNPLNSVHRYMVLDYSKHHTQRTAINTMWCLTVIFFNFVANRMHCATVLIVHDIHIILPSHRTLIETRTTGLSAELHFIIIRSSRRLRLGVITAPHTTAVSRLCYIILQFVNGVLKYIFNCGQVYDRWRGRRVCDVRSLLTAQVSTTSNYAVYISVPFSVKHANAKFSVANKHTLECLPWFSRVVSD